jgi:predicted RecB family nuclease
MSSSPINSIPSWHWIGENDLTKVLEISSGRAAALRRVGVRCFDDLYSRDPEGLSDDLAGVGLFLTVEQVKRMRCHIQSYREGRPVRFGPLPSLGDKFVVLDLEYDIHEPRIWTFGLCFVDGDSREYALFWAEDDDSEREGLERIAERLEAVPDAPIVTWWGIRADFPQLKEACKRLGLPHLFERFYERHVDLCVCARNSLRLPIPSLGLGEVAAFFGAEKDSSIENGLAALNLYRRYRTRYSPRVRKQIKDELLIYNRDDLNALIDTARAIEALPPEVAAETAGEKQKPPVAGATVQT